LSKDKKRTAKSRQTGANTAALPVVAPSADEQDELDAPEVGQLLDPTRSDTVAASTPERSNTAIIAAAPLERNDIAPIEAATAAPGEPLPGNLDRHATTILETPTAAAANNGHSSDGDRPTTSLPGTQFSAPHADGNGQHPAENTVGAQFIAPDPDGNGNGYHHDGDGSGHYADLAATEPIYEATAGDEELSTQHSALSTGSIRIPALRPRRYPLSHTGVKHGARLVSRSPRLEALQQRRLMTAAVGVGAPRLAQELRRTALGHRLAASDRRYPVFLMRQRGAAVKKGGTGLRVFIILALLFFVTFSTIVGGLVGGYFVYARDLPSVSTLSQGGNSFETTRIYDRNGILLAEVFDQGRRTFVPLSKISKYLIDATIATEDATFYSNVGVDPFALARAVLINVRGTGTSGASTITQQLARIMLLASSKYDRTLDRKIREAILAVQITQAYSKDQILEMYLNQIYYGNLAYGIEAASESYFGKHASELTLSEAALLAGLPQSPSNYDPTQNLDAAKARQLIVLGLMQKTGKITYEQEQAAASAPIILHPVKSVIKAPHFVQYVKEYLDAQYGPDVVSRGGLVVTTTLDLRVQAEAERAAVARVSALKELSATNAAMVVMKPDTGEILAMVGSVDYNNTQIDGQVNVATRERQPGSSLKPIVYAAAFQKGWTPATSILDVDTVFAYRSAQPYEPHNYDRNDHGWVTARTALANSFNIPAVKTLQFAGVQNVLDLAHAMGIKTGLYRSPDWYGLSLALGGGEVTLLEETDAYATFANGGRQVDATPILKMTDSRGQVIQQVDPNAKGASVLDPGIAYQITSILSDNNARSWMFGPTSPLKVSFPAAAKTGTTDDNRDSWTLGYTPNLVVGVWVGNNDNSKMLAVTGALGAAYIWHDFMESFYANPDFKRLIAYNLPGQTLASGFTPPSDVVKQVVCTQAKGDVSDYFIAGKVPTDCKGYKDPPQNKVRGYAGNNTPVITRPTRTPSYNTNTRGAGSGNATGNGSGDSTNNGSGSVTNPTPSTDNGGATAPPNPPNPPPSNPPPADTPVPGTNPVKPAGNGEATPTNGGGG
jgi:1A family penicillin-binding protein